MKQQLFSKLHPLLRSCFYAFPTLALAGFILWPSMVSLTSVIHFKYSEKKTLQEMENPVDIKRHIQGFFLRYQIPISQEDIFLSHRSQKKVAMKKYSCPDYPIALYVPFVLRFPYFGNTTYEWCLIIKE